MEVMSLNTLLMVFGGGVVGACLGGLFSFVVCGFIVLLGCASVLGGGSDLLLFQVGLGPLFGPHVGGFSTGVVASTYAAAIKKNHPGGGAKDILSPLMNSSADVLLIGGISGLAGHLILQAVSSVPILNMTDCIATTVVLQAMGARLFFQKQLFWGNTKSIKKNGYLNTNSECAWCPWNMARGKLVMLGLGVGLLSGAVAFMTRDTLAPLVAAGTISEPTAFVTAIILVWAIAAISLIGLNFGTGSIQMFPVWHAQAILSAIAFMYFDSLLIAGITGIAASMLQELMARMFWNHGDNHIDPPACAIALGTLILNLINKL